MSQHSQVPTNWSLPFIERGDVVRLKDPYHPNWGMAHEPVKQRLRRVLFEDSDVDTSFADGPADVRLSMYRDSEAAAEYLELTHGTVVQIVSRYSAGTYDLSEAAAYLQDGGVGHTRRPVRNVDLHLYNPSVGVAYFDSGTGPNGIPTYVQEREVETTVGLAGL